MFQITTNDQYTEIEYPHPGYYSRGKTLAWKGSDSEIHFEQVCKDPDKKELLRQLGWLDPGCISYDINSHGFRDEEFDLRPSGLALGCSFTEGTGLPEHATWPKVLSKLANIHIWNLGVAGSGIDTCFRLLDFWLPKLLPKFVVLCIPPDSRVEVFSGNQPVTLMPGCPNPSDYLNTYYKVWIDHPANSIVSKRKNLLAMQQLCDQAGIPLIYLDCNTLKAVDLARDLSHAGVMSQANLAEEMYNLLPKELL